MSRPSSVKVYPQKIQVSESPATPSRGFDIFNSTNNDSVSTPTSSAKRHQLPLLSELVKLISERGNNGVERLDKEFQGVYGLATALRCDLRLGLRTLSDIDESKIYFGKNEIQMPKPLTFLKLVWEALHDPVLIILMISGCISLVLGSIPGVAEEPSHDWIEGVAILFAVVVVVTVSAMTELQKQKQFKELEKKQNDACTVEVIRGGATLTINVTEIVVGDLVKLQSGAIICADGILIEQSGGVFATDESSLTGESKDVIKDLKCNPFILSGSFVKLGEGKMVVTCVGLFSEEGCIQKIITGVGAEESKMLVERDEDRKLKDRLFCPTSPTSTSPALQKKSDVKSGSLKKKESLLIGKLGKMAIKIGMAGTMIALLVLIILLIRYCISYFAIDGNNYSSEIWAHFVKIFITAITVLVVAVPEGLPLAVTISLAFSVNEMQTDHCLVKVLAACETMGNATMICCDKTGTLTTNKMTVVRAWIGGLDFGEVADIPNTGTLKSLKSIVTSISNTVCEDIANHMTANCSADSRYECLNNSSLPTQYGNKTDCALLFFADTITIGPTQKSRPPLLTSEKLFFFPFDSTYKRSTSIIALPQEKKWRILVKGASEVVLNLCKHLRQADGTIITLDENRKERLHQEVINSYAKASLRVILMAYKDLSIMPMDINDADNSIFSTDLIVLAFFGIQDPVRPEVPSAVLQCQNAGVGVRMLTGDNMLTAEAIANNCGIFTPQMPRNLYSVMEGPTFRSLVIDNQGNITNLATFALICQQLRVMGRCSPQDKYNLVRGLRHFGHVVAVTGDGTNDGPALSEADVGFAMGITGTAIAKRAADIVITNDSFAAIVKAISWGRNVYDSISKFLVFQLTVNLVAVTVTFFGACILGESPLSAVQLLWVNMIMDSFASLALATEKPKLALMQRKPYARNMPLITPIIFRNIVGHSLYQLIICFIILWAGPAIFSVDKGSTAHYTMLFNTFVCLQLFNEINVRCIHNELNMFENLLSNTIYLVVLLFSAVAQVIIVEFGGMAFKTAPLNGIQWMSCILLGLSELPMHILITLYYPMRWIPRYLSVPLNESDSLEAMVNKKIPTASAADAPILLQASNTTVIVDEAAAIQVAAKSRDSVDQCFGQLGNFQRRKESLPLSLRALSKTFVQLKRSSTITNSSKSLTQQSEDNDEEEVAVV